MARTQKHSNELLLDSVIKYAEVCKTKIMATELAEWARRNVEGLEDVHDYHFTRPYKERNKSGKVVQKKKLCTEKIEELNNARSVMSSVNTNILLKASNIETFFEQEKRMQRKLVAETRNQVDRIVRENVYLAKENAVLRQENARLKSIINKVTPEIKEIRKLQNSLSLKVKYLMSATDEEKRREILSREGIMEGNFDLNRYMDSLRVSVDSLLDIAKEIRNLGVSESDVEENSDRIQKEMVSLKVDLLDGLDFGDDE